MPAFTLRVGEPVDRHELFPYVRVPKGEGLDPFGQGQYLEPGFSDSPLAEGQELVSTDAKNREIVVPVIFHSASTDRSNLLYDPSFENTASPYMTTAGGSDGGMSAARSTEWASSGDASWKVTGSLTASTGFFFSEINMATGAAPIACTPGETLRVRADVNVTVLPVAALARLDIKYLDASKVFLSQATSASASTLGVQTLTATHVVPASAAYVVVLVGMHATGGVGGASTAYFDRVLLSRDTTSDSSYIDGDSKGVGWTGAANASPSRTYVGKTGLHRLVRDVTRRVNAAGARVEWRDDSATLPTYYDLVFGRFEPDFDYFRSRGLYAEGVLRLQTRPYGHTATSRLIATAATTGPHLLVPIPSGSIDGDAPALVTYLGGVGSQIPWRSDTAMGFAPLPHASWAPVVPAASLQRIVTNNLGTVGASGAAASQAMNLLVNNGPFDGSARISGGKLSAPLPIPSVYAGRRVRVVAVARTDTPDGVGMWAQLDGDLPLATAVATAPDWHPVDLGVVSVPSITYGASMGISITLGQLPTPAAPLQANNPGITEVLLLPEDDLTVLTDRGYRGVPQSMMSAKGKAAASLSTLIDDVGNAILPAGAIPDTDNISGAGVIPTGALFVTPSAFITASPGWLSGAAMQHPDLTEFRAHMIMRLAGGTNAYELHKAQSTGGLSAVLNLASTGGYLTLKDTAGGVLFGSVGLSATSWLGGPSAPADGCYGELELISRLGVVGARLRRYGTQPLVTASLTALPVASVGFTGSFRSGEPGKVTVAMRCASGLGEIHRFHVESLRGQPTPVAAGDQYVAGDVAYRQSAASQVRLGMADMRRGNRKTLSPSAPAVVVFEIPLHGGPANDVLPAEVRAQERFTYAR